MKVLGVFVLAAIVVIFFSCILFIGGCDEGYSDGERTGLIVKLSRKGVFCKTWEGQMNLGGMAPMGKDSAMVPTVFNFTIADEAVLAKAQEAQRAGKTITVKYVEWLVAPSLRSDHGYFITEVR